MYDNYIFTIVYKNIRIWLGLTRDRFFVTAESLTPLWQKSAITKSIFSANTNPYWKRLYPVSQGPRGSWLMKKTRGRKSRVRVPLKEPSEPAYCEPPPLPWGDLACLHKTRTCREYNEVLECCSEGAVSRLARLLTIMN
jgi:hypothetical protein